MIKSIKRMVLTGAAVAVMMSLASPAIAQEVRDHRDGSAEAGPIVRDHRDGSGGILCDFFSISCEPPSWNVSDPVIPPVADPDPVVDPEPKHCQFLPKVCKPPFDDVSVLDPVENEDPVVTDPPGKEDPGKEDPGKEDPHKDESDTNGSAGNSSGGSNGGSAGSVSSASQTIDLGGTFMSGFLPYTLTSTIGDVANSGKNNLPASVAKSLPNTGGGWSFLLLVGAALVAVGLVLRSIARRTTSITRTTQQ